MDSMECSKWQEEGLLFISGESDQQQEKEFREHLLVCADCKAENDQYHFEKKQFFAKAILEDSPSDIVNSKIIAACSQKPVMTRGFSVFSGVWMKKAVVSTLLLVFGMGAGAYFVINYFSTDRSGAALTTDKTPSPTAVSSDPKNPMIAEKNQLQVKAVSGNSAMSNKNDSTKANETSVFSAHSKAPEGIIKVGEKKE